LQISGGRIWFFEPFDTTKRLLSGLQQPFPAICHALPKNSIIFVSRLGGEGLTLFNLILKEIGRVEHFDHHNKKASFLGLKQINV
jgi:hypothetical protein